MLSWFAAAALAGTPCEATCARLGPCVGDASPQGLAQCVSDCGAIPLPADTHAAVASAPTCDAAAEAFVLGVQRALVGGAAVTASSPEPAAPTATVAEAPRAAAGGGCRAPKADAQVLRLLTATAWCSYGYSGSTETSSRFVLAPDGRLGGQNASETVRTGQNTNQYGDVTQTYGAWGNAQQGHQGCWDVVGGNLALSQDGVSYAPGPTQLTQNSNGYPILVFNGTEYFTCN